MPSGCVFCNYRGPSEILHEYPDGIFVIEPINPVTDGHRLVIPRVHLPHAVQDPRATGYVMEYACVEVLRAGLGPVNIITSVGAEATQTVEHLHIHLVPRSKDDGLKLPWSP